MLGIVPASFHLSYDRLKMRLPAMCYNKLALSNEIYGLKAAGNFCVTCKSASSEGLEAYIKPLMDGLPRDIIRLESSKFMTSANSIPPSIPRVCDKAGQGHVFRFVNAGRVNAQDACELVETLRELDLLQIVDLFERSTKADNVEKKIVDQLLPLEEGVVHQLRETAPELRTNWHDLGLEAVSKGMVGALILGGGQGTRLGSAD